jgi:hypothetical protein
VGSELFETDDATPQNVTASRGEVAQLRRQPSGINPSIATCCFPEAHDLLTASHGHVTQFSITSDTLIASNSPDVLIYSYLI